MKNGVFMLQFNEPVETDVALDNLDFIFSREGRGYNQACCVCRDNCGVHHVVVLLLCHRLFIYFMPQSYNNQVYFANY